MVTVGAGLFLPQPGVDEDNASKLSIKNANQK